MSNAILIILTMLVGLPGPVAQTAAQVPDRASLEGVVVLAGTEEPIDRARILLANVRGGLSDAIVAEVDERGKFAIRGIPPGTYRLFAHHDDYVRAEYGQRAVARPGITISLSAGQAIADIRISLTPTGVVSGRILNANGEPAPGILISAVKRNYVQGERVTTSIAESQTNDLGEYRLYGLPPGPYLIRATPFGFRSIQGGSYITSNPPALDALISISDGRTPLANLVTRGNFIDPDALEGKFHPAVYYPGTVDSSAAQPIEVPPGATIAGVNFTMINASAFAISGKGVRVRGQLIDGKSGQPSANSSATLHLPERPYRLESMLQTLLDLQTGSFEFTGVTPGRYLISGDSAAGNGEFAVEVGNSDVEDLRIILNPRTSLAGRIAIEGPSDTDISLLAGTIVRVQSSTASQATAVRPDGTFTFPNLRAGEYRIELSGGPANYYLKAAVIGEKEVLNAGIVVSGPTTQLLELLVSPKTGKLEGFVGEDGRGPAAAVTVVVVPNPARRRQYSAFRTAVTDAFGRFQIEGLTPGDYKVFAWEDIEVDSWQDPEVLRAFEERGQAIRIAEGAQVNLDLRMIHKP